MAPRSTRREARRVLESNAEVETAGRGRCQDGSLRLNDPRHQSEQLRQQEDTGHACAVE